MTKQELELVIEKLKTLIAEIELLVYPVRNIYEEQEKLESNKDA
jgi:hypothetical protein